MKSKRIIISLFILCFLVSTGFVNVKAATYNGKSYSSDYTTWKQGDSAWGGRKLGELCTMSDSGCLITSIAILMAKAGVENPNSFCPGTLRDRYEAGGFITHNSSNKQGDGNLYDAAFSQAKSPKFYKIGESNFHPTPFAQIYSTIKSKLDAGYYAVVKVNYGSHFVAVNSCSNGEVYIYDPGYTGRTKLSVYNGGIEGATYFKANGATPPAGNTIPKGSQTISDGDYHIVSALDNSLGLNVAYNSTGNSANIQLWNSMGDADTSSVVRVKHMGNGYYRLEMRNSGKMIDVKNGSKANKTNVQQYQDNGTDSQRWVIKYAGGGYFYIVSKLSGLYLDVSVISSKKGANIQMYNGNGTNAQKWKFIAWGKGTGRTIEDGEYQILSGVNTAYGLDVYKGSTADRTNIQLYEAKASVNQTFQLKYIGDGYYTIKSKVSGKMLDVAGAGVTAETNLQQFRDNGNPAQRWIIKDVGNGFYSIVSKCNGLYVDLYGGNARNEQNVQMFLSNGTNAQKWAFVKVQKPKVSFDLQGGVVGKAKDSHALNGTNIGRATGYLVVYSNSGQKITTNQYGSEAAVDADGKVIELRGYGETKNLTVPKGGFIVSGHLWKGDCGHAFTGKLKKGDYVGYDIRSKKVLSFANKNSYILNHKYVNSGEKYGILPTPTKSGYIFKGWYTAKSGGTKVTEQSKCSSYELYARWEAKETKRINKTELTSLTASVKGFTAKWSKQTGQTSGYELMYSTNSNFSGAKTIVISKNSTVSRKVTGLSAKKKYYVRVRTYKTLDKTKMYSLWSKVKAVTTK